MTDFGPPAGGEARDLAELKQLWAERYARRADGGWWALSGFAVQTSVALERFVRAALIETGPRNLDAELETIGDFLLASDTIHVTQVKRSLTKSTLGDALEEAAAVASLCTPALFGRLRFQILCERCEPGLSTAAMDGWRVFPGAHDANARLMLLLSRFDPDAPIMVTSDPRLALRRTLLRAGVRNPEAVVRDALGRLFDAFDGRDRSGVQKAVIAVLDDVRRAAEPGASHSGRVLAAKDFAPRPTLGTRLFAASRPRLHDLVNDRFRARPERLPALLAAAEGWLTDLDVQFRDDDLRLPVFCLEGASGDGKSVLSLQLIASLVVSGRLGSVTELLDPGELEAWLVTAPAWADDSTHAEIGFLDDLPACFSASDLNRLVDRAFYRRTPYAGLITCGTTEAVQMLTRAGRVRIMRAAVAPPSAEELNAFQRWAEIRLGSSLQRSGTAANLAAFMAGLAGSPTQPNPVTRAVGALEAARAAAAAGALEQVAPVAFASEAALDILRDWAPGLQFEPEHQAGGVRFAHAEAVWHVYRRLVGEAPLVEAWGKDLASAVAEHLAAGERTTARALVGELLNRRVVKQRLQSAGVDAPPAALIQATFDALERRVASVGGAPLFRLWMAAAAAGRLRPADAAALRRRGAELLVGGVLDAGDETEVAVALLTVGPPAADEASRLARAALRRAGRDRTVLKFATEAFGREHRRADANLALSWIRRHLDWPAVADALAAALAAEPTSPTVELGYAYLERHASAAESARVLRALGRLPRGRRFYAAQDQWLARQPEPDAVAAVYLEQLAGKMRHQYADRALTFVSDHPDAQGVHEITAALLRDRSWDPEVRRRARLWLAGRPPSSRTTPVVLALVAGPGEVDALADDLPIVLDHVRAGVGGSGMVFAATSDRLKAMQPEDRHALRSRLGPAAAALFDQAVAWRRAPART